MINNNDISKVLGDINNSPTALDTLIEFEGTLDNLHLYAYANWDKGEVISGPDISRYWVEVTLMYPEKHMPDPEGALRLTRHECYVYFQKEKYTSSIHISSPDDIEADKDGKRKPKKMESKVWLVKISIPRHKIDEFNSKQIEINGVEIDMSDISDAYDEDLNTAKELNNDSEDGFDDDEF